MIAAEGSVGRVFTLRLEDGDRVPECIEGFAAARGVSRGVCWLVGAVGSGTLVVGPENGEARPVVPAKHVLEGVRAFRARLDKLETALIEDRQDELSELFREGAQNYDRIIGLG